MNGRTFLAIALAFAAHALGGQVPSADEIFARLRDRAQRLNGLRCTLDIQGSRRGYHAEARKRLEFRAPGCLRLESLPRDDSELARTFLRREIAVLTPNECWSYLVWRDEVVTWPAEDRAGWHGETPEGWDGIGRVFAAMLAPEALYKDHDVRRVFPDVLGGKRCWLLLVAKKGMQADRVWVDPERWTVLRVQRGVASREDRMESGDRLAVISHQEVAPGIWLPTEARRHAYEAAAARVRDVEVGHLPPGDRFALPKDTPLVRRSSAAGKELEQVTVEPVGVTGYSVRRYTLPACYLDPQAPGEPDPTVHLRRFIARSPTIRAGYYELMDRIGFRDRKARSVLVQQAAKARPDDPYLRWLALEARFSEAPTLDLAEKLAPLAGEYFALETRLRAQTVAGDHAAARETARKLLEHMVSCESKRGFAFATLVDAAEKGGWLQELRRECEQRAAAEPPSELHLRMLPYVARRAGEKAKIPEPWARIAELRRDSPEVQIECARQLAHGPPEEMANGVRIYARLLDGLSEDSHVFRSQALAAVAWLGDRARRGGLREAHPLTQLLEADLREGPAKLNTSQRVWRHRLLAFCLSWGDAARAAHHLRQAAELAPEDESLRMLLVKQLLRSGRNAEAIELFDRLRGQHPGRPELWLACGSALPAKEMPDRAHQVIEGLMNCAPTEPETARLAKDLYAGMERFDEAARWALEFAERDHPGLRLDRKEEAARLLMQAQDAPRAVAAWLDVLKEAANAPPALAERQVMGHVSNFGRPNLIGKQDQDWVRQQWVPALEATLQRAGKEAPAAQRAALHLALGSAWRALGEFQKAAAAYARGLKLLPKFDEGRKWLDEIAPGYPLDDF